MRIRNLWPRVKNNHLLVEHRIARRLDKVKNKFYAVILITAALIIYNIIIYFIYERFK